MNPNILIWTAALGLLCKTVLTMLGVGFDLLGASSGGPVVWLFGNAAGLLSLAIAVGLPVVLARPYLSETPMVTRPPLFTLVVVTALCGAATAGYLCLLVSIAALLSGHLGGFLVGLAGASGAGYGVWRVARLHLDPEGELSPGLLAGIGGMLLLVGAPLTGIFCLGCAGYAATQA